MLRLSPPSFGRIDHATSFTASYGGGEANVAVSLANYGLNAYFVSKLPNNELGDAVVRALKADSVGTEGLVRGGERLGVYFLERGAGVRASKVLYDRRNSALARAHREEFDFEAIFKDAHWFHISGITPALSPSCAKITEYALKTAHSLGITTSFDLNYRAKLWSAQEAQATCLSLMPYVDVCVGNEEDIEHVLGYAIPQNNVRSGTLNVEGYKQVFSTLYRRFNFKAIATTLRESYSASENGWSALLYDGKKCYHSKKYRLPVVDRVGAGDAFCAGLIYGFVAGDPSVRKRDAGGLDVTSTISPYTSQEIVEFAVAASALKHSIEGDVNQVSVQEVERVALGDVSGRVLR